MTNRQKYILDRDDDCHWYLFPIEKKEHFQKWIDIHENNDYDNPDYGNQPEWLKSIDSPNRVVFENPEEI